MKLNADGIKNVFVNFLVPLISLGGIAALFLLIIWPSINNIPLLKSDLETKKSLQATLAAKKEKLSEYTSLQATLEENSELVSNALASEAQVPELLTQIDTIANESGLEVVKLSYSFSEVPQAAPVAAPQPAADGTTPAAPVAPDVKYVLVNLGVEGNTSQLIAFLNNLEDSARVVTVDRLRFARTDNEEGSSTLSMNFVLSSPYLFVNSQAVTDEPISIDISSPEFLSFVTMLKDLKYYTPTVNEDIDVSESSEDEDEENTDAENPEDDAEAQGAQDSTEEILQVIENAENQQ